jgi:protoporphyrinogen oxidase
MRDRWIPYPFQNNIWRLPQDELLACLDGLFDTQTRRTEGPPPSFREWLLASFGQGLCDTFMFPYNQKVWAYPPSDLDTGWMGERVATVDLRRVVRNVVLARDDVGWGPNATFSFPLHGGTGAIWSSLARQLPADRMRYGARVVTVDTGKRTLGLSDGSTIRYDTLISTMPLDLLVGMLTDRPDLAARRTEFVHSSSHIVGLGIDGPTPPDLATKCWMYFPESTAPFYRATVFSNYSPHNVPRPGAQWSLMAEVSESPKKPVDVHTVVEDTIRGFIRSGLLTEDHTLLSRWHRRLEHGYPTPWLGRDTVLEPVNQALEDVGIYSRGRFGAWKYEVSNQDHSLMQGVEAVERILHGSHEHTFHGDMRDYPLD